jgi:hypothetical protein
MADDIIDLRVARARHEANASLVACPRCHLSNDMESTRCLACGLWFDGVALQFAPRDGVPERIVARRTLLRRLVLALFAAALAAIALAVVSLLGGA